MRSDLYPCVLRCCAPFALLLFFSLGSTTVSSQCQLHCPGDTLAECGQTTPDYTGYATLEPCSGFGQYADEVIYNGDCTYTILRTWSYEGLGSCLQVISVTDTSAPIFPNLPSDLLISCLDALPPMVECPAVDACDDDLETDSFIGGVGGTDMYCLLSTAFGPGPDWAFHMEDIVPGVFIWTFQGDAHFDTYSDGTAHLWGTIVNPLNTNQGFEVEMWLENGMNWDQWSALGRNYKDDLNIAGDLYPTWDYYELANNFSILNGIGDFAGSQVVMHHYPYNYYFGFQCGLGANNKNLNNGLSGWFAYEGFVNGEWVQGEGDLNADKTCEDGCAGTTVSYIWRAEDDCGHISYAVQHIVVVDSEAPVVDPYDEMITLPCEDYDGIFITATDACSEITFTYTDEIIVEGCNGTVIRHYLVSDACGNSVEVDQTIQLFGEDQPYFISFPADISLNCDQLDNIPSPNIEYTSGCNGTILSESEQIVEGDCPFTFDILYTFTLTDDCENEMSAVWTIHISDTEAPVIYNIPGDTTIGCGDPVPDGIASVVDNCDSEPTISVSATTVQMECGYLFIRTWVATDACGNSSTVSQTVTVSDLVPPVFVYTPPNVSISCSEEIPTDMAEATDECSEVSVSYEDELVEDCAGSIVRYFTATDGCGNTATTIQHINRYDNTPPVFSFVPAMVKVECGEAIPFVWAEVQDNCSQVALTYEDIPLASDCAGSFNRVFYAQDECGNISSAVQEIVVTDATAPVFTFVPGNAVLTCSDEFPGEQAEAVDDCSSVTITESLEMMDGECPMVYLRHFFATDACGNTSEAMQQVIVADTVAPVFTFFPEDILLSCDEPLDLPMAEASDQCSEPVISFEDEFSDDCSGSFVRTYTATDACGNAVSSTQQVTVVDSTAPYFTSFPENVVVSCENVPPVETVEVEYADNCSEVSVLYSEEQVAGDCPGTYTLLRTWSLSDACGNTTDQTWTVSVQDLTPPVLMNVPPDMVLECGQDEVQDADVTAMDNCSGALVVSESSITEEADCGYYFIRTWTATDECGNTGTATQQIHFDDTTNPYWLAIYNDTVISCSEEIPPIVVPPVEDACDQELEYFVSEEIYPGACPNEQQIQRVYRAFDDCGNYAIFAHTIFVVDDEAPVFEAFPETVEVPCTEFLQVTVDATDNCGTATVTHSDVLMDDESCAGTILRTYTATDECNNTSMVQQLIHLVDNQAPVFLSFPEDTSVSCDSIPDTGEADVQYSDNCSEVLVDFNEEILPGECVNSYELLRTWTLSDVCGNAVSMTWTISVSDDVPPAFSFLPEDMTIECTDEIPDVEIVATDNCTVDPVVGISAATVETECGYIFTRTWFTEDECGNTTSYSQNITVSDFTPPVLSDFPEDFSVTCGESIPDAPVITATDNCAANVEVNFTEEILQDGDCIFITRTWCAQDCVGNTSCWTQQITSDLPFQGGGPQAIKDDGASASMSIIRQPFDQALITLQVGNAPQSTIELFDLAGHKLIQLQVSETKSGEAKKVWLNTNALSPGLYLARYTNGREVLTGRLFIDR